MEKTQKNIITSLLLRIITIICGFIIPKLIISNYGSNVNGLVSSISQFLGYIVLLEAGFGPIIKSLLFKPIVKNDKETIEKILKSSERIFRKISYIFIIYIMVLCVIYPFITREYNFLYTISLIIIISISTFFEYFFGMTFKLFLQADQKHYVSHIVEIITLIFNTILVVILVKAGASIQLVKLVSAIIFVFRPIINNIYVKKKYNINLKDVDDNYEIKQKWDALAQHVSYVIHNNTDVVVITLCLGLKEVSVYAIYLLIINSLKSIVNSFIGGVDSSFGKLIVKGENKELNRRFNMFIIKYFTLATIVFVSTLFLIIPFVKLYVLGVKDANYIRPLFAYIMIISKFILTLKEPYYDLVKVAGHFKQTKKGAILEAVINVVLSFALVFKFGILGVAIGTLVSVLIRTIEIMYYTSKNLLKIDFTKTLRKLFIILIEFIIIYIALSSIESIKIDNYFDWIMYAFNVLVASTIIVSIINFIAGKVFRRIDGGFYE